MLPLLYSLNLTRRSMCSGEGLTENTYRIQVVLRFTSPFAGKIESLLRAVLLGSNYCSLV